MELFVKIVLRILGLLLLIVVVILCLTNPDRGYIFLIWAMTLFIIGVFSREWLVYLLLFLIPLFIHQPGTNLGLAFDIYLIVLLSVFLLRENIELRIKSETGFFPLLLVSFIILTVLSFLPWLPVIKQICYSGPSPESLLFHIFSAKPNEKAFIILKCYHFISAIVLYFFFNRLLQTDTQIKKSIQFLEAGFLLSIALGYLDYFNFIGLEFWREANYYTQLGGIKRFQSFSGHPAWFAEYVTLTLAFLIVKIPSTLGWKRYVYILGILLSIGAIFLSLQIGAWITLVGFTIGLVIIIFIRKKDVGRLVPADSNKHFKSIVLFIICVIILIAVTSMLIGQNVPEDLDSFLKAKLHHRYYLMKNALHQFISGILIGNGPGTFAYIYRMTVPRLGSEYVAFNHSAHSTYFQLLSEMGLVGLCIMIFIPLFVIHHIWKYNIKVPDSVLSFGTIAIGGAMMCFLIYSTIQNIFFIRAIEITFWLLISMWWTSMKKTTVQRNHFNLDKRSLIVIVIVLISFFIIQNFLISQFTYHDLTGFYHIERNKLGNYFRWTDCIARINIPANSKCIDIHFALIHPDIKSKPVHIVFCFNGKIIEQRYINQPGKYTLHYPFQGVDRGTLEIKLNRTWSPYYYGISQDRRLLGTRINLLSFNGMENYWQMMANDFQNTEVIERNRSNYFQLDH